MEGAGAAPRSRSRSPRRQAPGPAAEPPKAEVHAWQVLTAAGVDVYASCDHIAEVLGHKPRGTVLYGWQECDSWVGLSDEPGYLPVSSEDGTVLLKKASLPAARPLTPEEAAAEVATSAEASVEGAAGPEGVEQEAAEERPKPWRCYGCGEGLEAEAELREHVRRSPGCSGPAWQAAVSAMACLPGAGTVLWCPACPDAFVGHWRGSATKAPSLLRHLSASAKDGQPHAAQHARLWAALLALIAADPPPPGLDGGDLQEWAMASRLLEATGPLLAKPGPEARKAMRKLQDRTLGPDPRGEAEEEPAAVGGEAEAHEAEAPVVAPAGPGYSFYNDEIPMDVFSSAQDQTQRTADGVPIMDLISSDEEPAPAKGGLTEL